MNSSNVVRCSPHMNESRLNVVICYLNRYGEPAANANVQALRCSIPQAPYAQLALMTTVGKM